MFKSFEDVTSSYFYVVNHKSDRLLLDTILQTSINYAFVENHSFLRQAFYKLLGFNVLNFCYILEEEKKTLILRILEILQESNGRIIAK